MTAAVTGGWGLAALLAAGIGSAAIVRPLWGLCIFTALFPFDYPLVHESPWTIYSGEIMLAGLITGLAVARRRPGGIRAGSTPARGAVGALAAICLAVAISAPGSFDRWAAVKQGLRWAELWGMLAVTVLVIRSRRDAGAALGVYVVVATALGVLGVAEVLAGPASWLNAGGHLLDENRNVVRAHGPFSPNAFAPYLGLALLVMTARDALWPGMSGLWIWIAAVPVAAALVLTQSRIGWVAAAAGLAVVVVARFRTRRRLLLAGVLAAVLLTIAVSAAFPGVAGRLASLRHPWRDGNFSFRVRLFQWAGAQWREHPLTGYGAGTYPRLIARTADPLPSSLLPAGAAHAHNLFVQVALETGLVGLLAWLAALIWLGLRLRDASRRDPATGAVGLGLLAAFLVNNTLEYTLVHSRGVLYAIGWGAVLGAARGGSGRGTLLAVPAVPALLRRLRRGTLPRDLALFSIFGALVLWSLFFSLPRSGAKSAAVVAQHYDGVVVVLVRDLSAAAWPEVRVGDTMPGIARVTRTDAASSGGRNLLVTIRVTGPIEYLNLRWPFPPRDGPLKIGSMIAFETERYRFMGEVIRKTP